MATYKGLGALTETLLLLRTVTLRTQIEQLGYTCLNDHCDHYNINIIDYFYLIDDNNHYFHLTFFSYNSHCSNCSNQIEALQ